MNWPRLNPQNSLQFPGGTGRRGPQTRGGGGTQVLNGYPGHPKKNFCFRSSGCPLLKPIGKPLFFFNLFLGLVGKYCPFLEKHFFFFCKIEKKSFFNHPAATPETEVFLSMAPLANGRPEQKW